MRFNRVFFFEQITLIQNWSIGLIDEISFDSREIEAGILRLNSAFGFLATLDMVSVHTGMSEDELLEWPYKRFYSKVGYLSHVNAYQKRLRDIYKRA